MVQIDILSAILTSFVPKLGFMHKNQKANPPAISLSFLEENSLELKSLNMKIVHFQSTIILVYLILHRVITTTKYL